MNRLKMKTTATLLIAIFMISTMAAVSVMAKKGGTTIQDGILVDSNNDLLVLGFDKYGYNYQTHMFRGRYCDYDRVLGGPFSDVNLIMKWNDAWLSNMDRDLDGILDRPDDNGGTYIGSGAWETNHMWGTYVEEGEVYSWDYFVKIVAVPEDAILINGMWYDAENNEIGLEEWGAFAAIQRVYNDPHGGFEGIEYLSSVSAGFGYYKP